MTSSLETGAPDKTAEASLTLSTPALTTAQIDAALFPNGRMWSGSTITFSFPTAASTWPSYAADDEQTVGFAAFSQAQQAGFRAAAAAWDRLIAPRLVETDDLGAAGQIRIAFTTHANLDDAGGISYGPPIPGGGTAPFQGDIWVNAEYADWSFATGEPAFGLLLHELGHSLGLKHPFEPPGALSAAFDSTRFTVMSYTVPTDRVAVSFEVVGSSIEALSDPIVPRTPMVLDVAAIQARYGADPTTATGADRYTYSSTEAFFATLYDAGGVDTLDLSNFNRPSDIDLAPGAYSSVGFFPVQAQIAAAVAQYPSAETFIRRQFELVGERFPGAQAYTWSNNLGIAFNTVIENAYGGSGDDTITGNDAGNGLLGGAGADFMRGLNGDDWMDAGAGADDANGNQGVDVVHGGDGADSVRGGQGVDSVYGDAGDDPHVNGNIGEDVVYGGQGADTAFGGQGNDILYGEDGNDWLSGDLGDDTLTGGPGADRFLIRPGGGSDRVTDFNLSQGDLVQVSPGVTYTLLSEPGGAVIDLGGGTRITLVGLAAPPTSGWLVVV